MAELQLAFGGGDSETGLEATCFRMPPPKRSLKGFERQIKRPVSGTAENDKKIEFVRKVG